VHASVTEPLELITSQLLYAEQAPNTWWKAIVRSVRKILEGDKKLAQSVRGIGLTGQMLGTVLLDKNGSLLMNSIIWLDQRAVKETEYIKNRVGVDELFRITGSLPLTGYIAPKLLWLRENRSDIYQKINKVLLPKDYIRYLLTGKMANEVTDAGGLYLMDVDAGIISQQMLDYLDLPKSFFPDEILESEDLAGYLTNESAEILGLEPGIPVVAGAADQMAGAISLGAIKEGGVSVS
jgi:xylulokinase